MDKNTFLESLVTTESGCHEWRGFTMKSGLPYGRIRVEKGAKKLTHRFAYELQHGEIPEDMCVCHKCDNPRCCNPEHLFLGTRRDNVADMDSKGRRRSTAPKVFGEQVGVSKLTEEKVRTIREARANGATLIELAERYNVHHSVISRAATGKSWKHIQP